LTLGLLFCEALLLAGHPAWPPKHFVEVLTQAFAGFALRVVVCQWWCVFGYKAFLGPHINPSFGGHTTTSTPAGATMAEKAENQVGVACWHSLLVQLAGLFQSCCMVQDNSCHQVWLCMDVAACKEANISESTVFIKERRWMALGPPLVEMDMGSPWLPENCHLPFLMSKVLANNNAPRPHLRPHFPTPPW
jgi:hypothetical protein